MDAYNQLADRIEESYPELLQEVDTDDLPDGKEKFYTLGNFVETMPADRDDGWAQYYIWIRTDHEDYQDQSKAAGALAHEFGHYLCRTALYPHIPGLGKYLLHKVGTDSRKPHQVSKDRMTNLILLIEEGLAWLLGWGILFRMKALTKAHLSYGWQCWKSYWRRVKSK